MSIEKKVNQYGQQQIIDNFDKIIKIGDKFLQVRLIETRKFGKREFTAPMPRARFIDSQKDCYYLVNKKDLLELKRNKLKNGK